MARRLVRGISSESAILEVSRLKYCCVIWFSLDALQACVQVQNAVVLPWIASWLSLVLSQPDFSCVWWLPAWYQTSRMAADTFFPWSTICWWTTGSRDFFEDFTSALRVCVTESLSFSIDCLGWISLGTCLSPNRPFPSPITMRYNNKNCTNMSASFFDNILGIPYQVISGKFFWRRIASWVRNHVSNHDSQTTQIVDYRLSTMQRTEIFHPGEILVARFD